MKVLPTDNDKENALSSSINQSLKHRRLMALAGSIDELSADKMLNEIEPKADRLISDVEDLTNIPHKAGELRMLREIRYKLIAEMVNKLKLKA